MVNGATSGRAKQRMHCKCGCVLPGAQSLHALAVPPSSGGLTLSRRHAQKSLPMRTLSKFEKLYCTSWYRASYRHPNLQDAGISVQAISVPTAWPQVQTSGGSEGDPCTAPAATPKEPHSCRCCRP